MKSFTPLEIKNFRRVIPSRNQKFLTGFTLIETLVTIAIFTLIMGAVSAFVIMSYQSYGYTWQQSIAIDEARRGIETMVKEIREAREGENGVYSIERAGDKDFIFYSDIDNDGKTERVRYYLGMVNYGSQTQKCVTYSKGGNCSVTFSGFLNVNGILESAQVKVSVEGDLGTNDEYVTIKADNQTLGILCQTGCQDCAGTWQGTTVFDVTNFASDNSIIFDAFATSKVGDKEKCSWEEPNHSMKAQFEFSWIEEIVGAGNVLKKGVTKAVVGSGGKMEYPSGQEKVSIITSYVRNVPPIFEYFDASGNKIENYPARLKDAKLMKTFLVINVDPQRPPDEFQLESSVQLRNLKAE